MGLEESKAGFFELNEGIFLISSNHMEKQQIEDGLNRETSRIMTVGDLVRAFTDLTTSEGVRASVIITDEIPTDIRKSLEEVREGIEVSGVPVFEIGTGEIVDGAYRFGTIPDFIDFARINRRKASISQVTDTEQRGILEELQQETEVKQSTIDELTEEVEVLEEELEEVKGKYTTLETQVEQVYKVQRDNAVESEKALRDTHEETARLFEVEQQKSEQYRKEKDEALGEMTELRFEVVSLEKAIQDKQNEIRKLERIEQSNKREIERHIREKDEIVKSKVDAEDHVLLNTELDKAREEINGLKTKMLNMEVEKRTVEYEKELIERENQQLKDGELNIQEIGRTMKLDKYKLESTELIYIKVFEMVPYLRLALQMFFDKISERVDGRSHMMIMRHDDGLDGEYFEGVPLWSKLKDVPASDRVFRMFPNHVMFARLHEWEKQVKLLVVVDNIKNNDYYLESRSRERFMTVVRRESDIQKYNLKGSPITVSGKSVFDVSEDNTIKSAGIQVNRRRLLDVKVDEWINNVWD